MRIALLAPYPIQDVVPIELIKPKYRNLVLHPAPWIKMLAKFFSKESKVNFKIFTYSRGVSSVVEVKINNICYVVIPQYEPARFDIFHLNLPARIQFRYHIDKFAPDIVHGFGTEYIYGLIASEFKIPSVVFIQGIMCKLLPYMDSYGQFGKKLLIQSEKKVLRKSNAIIVETNYGKNWVHSINPKANVSIIPHSVNPIFFGNIPLFCDETCLCIGSIYNVKGVDIAIKALSRTISKTLRLSIIGKGPSLGEMKNLAESLGVRKRIDFLGFLSSKKILSEMRKAQMLCVPSRMDTSPNVLSEAHAAGLPVIGTMVGGIPDMIEDGVDGFLVESGDYMQMAQCMDKLASDNGLRRLFGEKGREKVASLNNSNVVGEAHLKVYNKLLKR